MICCWWNPGHWAHSIPSCIDNHNKCSYLHPSRDAAVHYQGRYPVKTNSSHFMIDHKVEHFSLPPDERNVMVGYSMPPSFRSSSTTLTTSWDIRPAICFCKDGLFDKFYTPAQVFHFLRRKKHRHQLIFLKAIVFCRIFTLKTLSANHTKSCTFCCT